MKNSIYFLLCAFFVLGCSYGARADNPPTFTGGHSQSLTVCENATATLINTLLAVRDLDAGQTETWTPVMGAAHGTLAASTTAFSTGGVVTPASLSYTPAAGYTGNDSFSVMVSDGTFADTTTVHVTINPLPAPVTGIASICYTFTTTLGDSGGGTWSSSNTIIATVDPTGIVTGAGTGEATIIYTLATGCEATRVVTVNPVPGTIAGTFSVCAGQTAGIADGVSSGNWNSSNPAVATIDATTGFYTGIGPGAVTMTYILPDGCATTTTVTINATPAPITGVSAICLGAVTTFGETLPGGVWTSSNTAIATVAGGAITGIAAGSVVISYASGTCIATKTLMVNPIAPITGITSVCNGGTIALADAVGGGMWSSAAPGVATISPSGFVTSVAPGAAVVTYAMPTGCFTTASITINPVPLPIAGIMQVCSGAAITLTDPSGGGTWATSSLAEASINATTGVLTGAATGIPVITYSLSTGCRATTTVTINPVPGPVSGTLSVCAGFATGLSDAGSGTWTSSNTAVATIGTSSGYATGIIPGITTITYTLAAGCSVSTTVTVNPNPSAISGPSAVCQGAEITMSNTLAGGAWSTPGIGVTVDAGTGVVTGVAPGSATIVYGVGGCTVFDVIIVNAISPVTGNLSICEGASTVFTDATPGTGIWTSDSTDVATITPVTAMLTSYAPGTTRITYTLPTGCSAAAVLTVNPLPAPIGGTMTICDGATSTLIDSSGGTWATSNAFIARIDAVTGEVTAVGTGDATITYTLSTGCTATARVTVNGLPGAITGPGNVCPGVIQGFSDGGGGTWSSSNNAVATMNSATGYLTGVSAGTVALTYTLTGCITVKDVTVNPLPPAISGASSAVCLSLQDTLSDAGGGTWSSNNETVAVIDMATGLLTAHATGTATITYTLPSGCYTTAVVTVDACNVGVKQIANGGSDISVSPNPNKGDFVITGSLGTAGDAEVLLTITNMLGQVVYTDKVIAGNGSINAHVRTGNIAGGMYILGLRWGRESKVFHIVVQ